jgi:hypothetical protein
MVLSPKAKKQQGVSQGAAEKPAAP